MRTAYVLTLTLLLAFLSWDATACDVDIKGPRKLCPSETKEYSLDPNYGTNPDREEAIWTITGGGRIVDPYTNQLVTRVRLYWLPLFGDVQPNARTPIEVVARGTSGTMTLSVTFTADQTRSETITINVPSSSVATPSISGSGSGNIVTFRASSAGATSYNWIVDGGNIIGSTTGSSISVRPTSGCSVGARSRARGTDCNGNTITSAYSATRTVRFGAPATPFINGVSKASGNTNYYFEAVSAGATNTEWRAIGGTIVSRSSIGVTVRTSGSSSSMTLYVKGVNSCGKSSESSKRITLQQGGGTLPDARTATMSKSKFVEVEEPSLTDTKSVTIYPNPVKNNGMLKLRIAMLGNAIVEIININGAVVKKITSVRQDNEINVSDLVPGVYTVRVLDAESTWTERIVVTN